MKIKKKELRNAINNVSMARKLDLDGATSLSLVKLKKSLLENGEKYDTDQTDIVEAYATKDDAGNAIQKQKQVGDEIYPYYDYATPEGGKEASAKLDVLANEEVEIVIYKSITADFISALTKVTAEQAEALLLLVE